MPRAKTIIASSQTVRQSPRKRRREDQQVEGSPKPFTKKVTRQRIRPAVEVTPIDDVVLSEISPETVESSSKSLSQPTSSTKNRTETVKLETQEQTIVEQKQHGTPGSGKTRTKVTEKITGKRLREEGKKPDALKNEAHEQASKNPRKRKTKEEKDAEMMPLAARSNGLRMFVGAHVSIAKGVENAVKNAAHIGGNAFALFLKSQRKWDNPALKDENRDEFRKLCAEQKYDAASHVVPHGSYLVNLATPDNDKAKQAFDAFLDDLRRCEALGIRYYNFHPGTTNKEPLAEAIKRLTDNLNRALAQTNTVTPLLENMAGGGSVIGSRFTDLRDIIAGIKPEFKSRIGVCIDTCHTFAAGYDIRTPAAYEKTLSEFDQIVGLKYLKAMHINDSKAPFDSKRDLHQNIGSGFLGLRAFHSIMNDTRLQNIPLVLETPCERPDPSDPKGKKTIDDKTVWAREIKLLESLIGMDPEGAEFKLLEKDLSDRGRAERAQMENAIAGRQEKANKKLAREREKGQKDLSNMLGKKGSTNNNETQKGTIKTAKKTKSSVLESDNDSVSSSNSALSELSD